MLNRFERLREKLNNSIEKYGIESEKTRKLSDKFNKLLNKKYIESIKTLEKITSDFSKFPTINEWNKYAKEKDLLCSESIKYITGINWHELRNRIKLKV